MRQLALAGCLVTIDAMGTQTKIAEQIIEQEGDYALALKDNQGNLYDEVKATFSGDSWTISDAEILAYLDPEKRWKGLCGIGMVRAERRMDQEITRETRYFLLSFSSVKTFASAIRSNWGIENSVQWVLDLAFRDDESRVRRGHADENLAVLRHISLNLLRQEPSSRVGIHTKHLKAGWDTTYLQRVLAGVN